METYATENLEDAIDHYTRELGYRLDMIRPADSPQEALLSRDDKQVRLIQNNIAATNNEQRATNGEQWVIGRAGMEYRDLIPGRLGGNVIASHIRLTRGGEVSDYVHYHKVRFQVIYCLKGRIRVVYEDQGPPFWMEPGDCVLQPPEIRHRVLECTAGAEVLEISLPAEHETWVEHDIDLPMKHLRPDRDFSGQRFVRHVAAEAEWMPALFRGFKTRNTGIREATSGFAEVSVLHSAEGAPGGLTVMETASLIFYYVATGTVELALAGHETRKLVAGECVIIPNETEYSLHAAGLAELLFVFI